MKTMMHKVPLLSVAMVITVLVLTAPLSWADEHDEEPLPVGRLFFQLNDTDEDLGFHLLVDGEPWKTLEIDDPRDRRILLTNLQGRLRRQGLTEFKFESAEPNFEEFSAERFFRRFPEGEYDIEARRLDGGEYETTAVISHVLPAPPGGLSVDGTLIPEDCEADPVTVSANEAPLISWEAVTMSHPEIGTLPAAGIGIVRYEVSVERDEVVDEVTEMVVKPFLTLEANLEVLTEPVTQFQVPSGVLFPGDEVKFQILVQAVNGNETSSESCFVVGGAS